MYEVRSTTRLAAAIAKAGAAPVPALQAAAAVERGAEKPLPIAIVGIHGVSPIQQFAFQDQLAGGIVSYLNAVEQAQRSPHKWLSAPYWPRIDANPGDPVLKPSALRLYRDDETTPDDPASQVYDVYEGYWSPFSKGKTNIVSVLRWLLTITFLATSSTANIPATLRKLVWDAGYLLVALTSALLFLVLAVVAGSFAWNRLVALLGIANPPDFWSFAFKPLEQVSQIPPYGWLLLAADVVLAYLLVQLVVVLRTRAQTRARTAELRGDARAGGQFDEQTIAAGAFHFWTAILLAAFTALLAIGEAVLLWIYVPDDAGTAALLAAWLVVAMALLQGARGIADFAVENVLGDIQVYTTHDNNSTFFEVRRQIIDAVTAALLSPLKAVDITRPDAAGKPKALYAKIHVAGHSLGSTIALDVLIRVRQLVNEKGLDESEWGRIRSLTTFGTALEKTRFFFDVRNPSVSAAQQQWQNDVYGRFFTLAHSVLHDRDNKDGIYWSNHWYFRDVVANRIVSYRSDVEPGKEFHTWSTAPPHPNRNICRNVRLPTAKPAYAFVHGDYLGDPLFWKNVGPIFTG